MKKTRKIIALTFALLPGYLYAGDGYSNAKQAVLQQQCSAGATVDELLNHKHRNLHADQGWQVFALDNGDFLVERNFLVSKYSGVSYRWRVSASNTPQPFSEQAEKLCTL